MLYKLKAKLGGMEAERYASLPGKTPATAASSIDKFVSLSHSNKTMPGIYNTNFALLLSFIENLWVFYSQLWM